VTTLRSPCYSLILPEEKIVGCSTSPAARAANYSPPGINPASTRYEEYGLDDPELQEARDQIIALLPRLRRFCMALSGSADAGDDLTQSTIERALERLEQYQQGTRLDSWMFRIAQNINIDAARSRARRGTQVDVEALDTVMGDDGRQVVEGRSALAKAQAAMAALPEEQRTLMALVVIDGQSYKQASEMLGIPIGTVMSRIARARQSIGFALGGARSTQGV
jgi:RNA polymerase sigma-70 factor, ECF subfamily